MDDRGYTPPPDSPKKSLPKIVQSAVEPGQPAVICQEEGPQILMGDLARLGLGRPVMGAFITSAANCYKTSTECCPC